MITPESFADDAAIVAAETAHRLPPPSSADYPAAEPYMRHVLIIESPSLWYIAPHISDRHPSQCLNVAGALRDFMSQGGAAGITPGRYWISVGDDGNLEIGGRVAA